ncbi:MULTISPECIES: acyl-CoA dehydrogenase family protein [Sphingobium]|uniref:acyl-CoA dehydrogenase family protein n=1 Tax=Sphingobium TaxID=165695 RepID=UPI00159C7A31|nr:MULTISPECIES: acyl-CoA dehydrogenase family protein [unclassified Sphingobium]
MARDWAALPDDLFREEIRAWLQRGCPPAIRRPFDRIVAEEARAWHRLRNAQGLAAPGWPKEFGGAGLSVDQQIALAEEYERHRIARYYDMGVTMLGPTLIRYGTKEQQDFYLPRILSAEHVWCQGYSEPNAGSDLASLRTRAVRDGDDYIVNGQKIWTSIAHHATHCFALVRTSDAGRKQEGITFLLIDLATPGIRIRPIETLVGYAEFCELFFDDVRVPVANRVGEEGKGWTIAKSLLGFERLSVASPALARLAFASLRRLATTLGLQDDPHYHDVEADAALRIHELTCLFRIATANMISGAPVDADLSILKVTAAELLQYLTAQIIELVDERALDGVIATADGAIDVRQMLMMSLPASIFGGTSEVQRNILAKQWLDLPG